MLFRMTLFLRKLHRYLLLISMGFFFFLFYPPLYYCSKKPGRYKGMIRLRRSWAILSSLCVGIIYRFEFEEPIDWNKTYLICPNHTSNIDTSMICALMKKDNFCFMGKEELLDNLITGIFFRTVDIPVNRNNKMSAFRAYKAATEKIKAGISLIMFPEGGIADDYPPQLQEFKSGPFRLAIEQNVAILPISSPNTWNVMWDDGSRFGSRPGICRIFVHKPITTEGLTVSDADILKNKVYDMLAQKLKFDS